MMCYHKFVDGFGAMGDALTCVKCGYSKYPEALPLWAIALCRIVKNDGTYGSRKTFPFVVKFAQPITFKTDWSEFTHYFNRRGVLMPVEAEPWD